MALSSSEPRFRKGMNTAGKPFIKTIVIDDRNITATLADGRIISVPLWWSWRREDATPQQRMNCDGEGVHWPDIDEDISAQGMCAAASSAWNDLAFWEDQHLTE